MILITLKNKFINFAIIIVTPGLLRLLKGAGLLVFGIMQEASLDITLLNKLFIAIEFFSSF